MEATRFKTLSEAVNEYCTDNGRFYLHGWGRFYSFAVQAMTEASFTGVGFKQVKPLWLPVDGDRVWMPEGYLAATAVGVDVQGHFAPMLMDETMIDRPDACGGFGDAPIDPDIPSVKVGNRQLPVLYTGSYGSYGPFGPGTGWSWGWAGSGYWPGMDKRKSIYGYWRYFQEKGYILLNSGNMVSEVVVMVVPQPFEPGTINVLPETAVEYLKAYIGMCEAAFRKDQRGQRDAREKFYAEKLKLGNRSDIGTFWDMWVAAKGGGY